MDKKRLLVPVNGLMALAFAVTALGGLVRFSHRICCPMPPSAGSTRFSACFSWCWQRFTSI